MKVAGGLAMSPSYGIETSWWPSRTPSVFFHSSVPLMKNSSQGWILGIELKRILQL